MASAGLLGVAVWHLLRTAVPLVDLRTLTIRTFRASQTGGSLYRISILAVPFLLPLMFQDDFGWSAAKAGGVVIFVFVGNLCIKPATTPLLRRFGFRAVLVGSIGLGGAGDSGLRAAAGDDAARRDRGLADRRRCVSVDRVHRLQHDRLRRCRARRHGPREHPVVDPAAAGGRHLRSRSRRWRCVSATPCAAHSGMPARLHFPYA